MALRHRYSILCDDVRREDNGKLIVLGMYFGTIVVPMLPTIMPTFTVLSVVETDNPDPRAFRLSVQMQSLERSKTIAETRGFMPVGSGPTILPVKFIPFKIDEAGAYAAVLEIEGQSDPVAVVPFQVQMGNVMGLAG